jgi:hypothetical protein
VNPPMIPVRGAPVVIIRPNAPEEPAPPFDDAAAEIMPVDAPARGRVPRQRRQINT